MSSRNGDRLSHLIHQQMVTQPKTMQLKIPQEVLEPIVAKLMDERSAAIVEQATELVMARLNDAQAKPSKPASNEASPS